MDIYYDATTGFIKTAYGDMKAPIGVQPIITIDNPPEDLFNTMAVISTVTGKPKYYVVNGALFTDEKWVAPPAPSQPI